MAFIIPNQTTYSSVKPQDQLPTWTRPAGWLSITDTPGIVQFLVSDIGAASYAIETLFDRSGSENIYINWGDGVVDTITTNTSIITQHTYTTGGTPSGLGYDTWKITISGDVGATISKVVQRKPNKFSGATGNLFVSGVLEEYYGDGTCRLGFNAHRQYVQQLYLQYSKLPSVMSGGTTILSNVYGDGTNSCIGLRQAVMPTSAPNATDLQRTFWGCNNLTSVSLPLDMTGCTTLQNTFTNCWSLYQITLPPLSVCTTLSQAFQNCRSLENIEFLPALPSCINYSSAFQGCSNIRTAKLKQFPTALNQFITFSSAFNSCTNLEYVNLPALANTGSTLSMSATFQNCFSLKSFQAPVNFNTDTLLNAFNSCFNLQSCILPAVVPSLTSFQSAFLNCYTLPSFTFPQITGSGINLTSAFQGATSISELYFDDFYNTKINAVVNMCNGCTSLRKIRFPADMSAVQNFGNVCVGCTNLVEVIMPTTANGISGFNAAFSQCSSLTGITIPSSTSGGINFGGAFADCTSLETITFPSTFRATTLAGTFRNCLKLKNVVLSPTMGAITSYAQAFENCGMLESITLPTTSATTLTTISSMCNGCTSLTGITNTIGLGSTSTTGTIVDGTTAFQNCQSLQSLSLYCRFSRLGVNSTYPTELTSIRLFNTGSGQYAGSSQQLQVQYNNMDRTAIVQLFNDLPVVAATKNINVANNPGTSSLTAGDIAIATGKGWAVITT